MDRTDKPTGTPVALIREEGATFGLAVVPALPPDCSALLLVPEHVNAESVLVALTAMRGESLSYGLPTTRADFDRRYPPSSLGRVTRIELPVDLGLAAPPKPAPPKPARWVAPNALSPEDKRRAREKRMMHDHRAELRRDLETAEDPILRAKLEDDLASVERALGIEPEVSSEPAESGDAVEADASKDAEADATRDESGDASLEAMRREIEAMREERSPQRRRARHRDEDASSGGSR